MNKEEIFVALRERRKVLGLDQRELAQLSGVSVHALINLERGQGSPTLRTLLAVCDVLGFQLDLKFVNS